MFLQPISVQLLQLLVCIVFILIQIYSIVPKKRFKKTQLNFNKSIHTRAISTNTSLDYNEVSLFPSK